MREREWLRYGTRIQVIAYFSVGLNCRNVPNCIQLNTYS